MLYGFTSVSKITRNKSKLISLSYGVSNNGYVNRLNQQAVVIKLYKDKKYVQIPTGIRVFNGENISIHTLEIIKKLLLQYEFALYEYYEANNYPNLSLKDAKRILTSATMYSAKFVEFAKEYIEHSNKADGTKRNYYSFIRDIENYSSDILVNDITYEYGQGFIQYLQNKGVSEQAINGKIQMLKTILTAAEKILKLEKSSIHNIVLNKIKSTKKPHLTQSELTKVENAKFKSKRDEKIRDIFLASVYTGLRFSDVKTLNSSEIKNGWIEKQTQKTKVEIAIPINVLFNGKMEGLITKYGTIENLVGSIGENGQFNAKLKKIFDLCKLGDRGKTFTFHTARHTFATLLLEQGYSPVIIQKMLGHSNLKMTMNVYAAVTKNAIINDLKNCKKLKKQLNRQTY